MEVIILGDTSSLFVLSQCVTCSPVRWICTTWIGNFRDGEIWTQLPEFISFLLSYLNLSPRWGLKNNSSDLRKKTTNWGFLVIVIVQLSYCLKLQRAYCSSGFSHPLFSSVIFEVYWRVRELIKKERKQVTRCGGGRTSFTTHPSLSYLRIIIRPSQCPSPLKLCCRPRKSHKKKNKTKQNRELLTV